MIKDSLLSFYTGNKLSSGRPNKNGWVRAIGTSFATAVTSGYFALCLLNNVNIINNYNDFPQAQALINGANGDARLKRGHRAIPIIQRPQ